jgi:hypothetical protein
METWTSLNRFLPDIQSERQGTQRDRKRGMGWRDRERDEVHCDFMVVKDRSIALSNH